MNPKSILRETFGYDKFRPLQKEIINAILNKNDSLVIMPTGGGKSLCFQIPALIFKGLTIVISPLISLMKDQVQQLTEVGVKAVFLNSSLSIEEYANNVELIRNNQVKLLYVAPETLTMPKTLSLLATIDVDCITVDEAHCISEWGHDFRPEYRTIAEVKQNFPDSVTVAFTATATPRVQEDIIKSLRLEKAKKFIASFDRKNLYLQVAPKTDPLQQTVDFLQQYRNQSGIIYCFSRRQVDELYEELKYRGFSVLPYHAGLSDADRKINQEKFINDDIQIIVATIAFGMGINKPNVRFVVHFDLPKNIESYYQEIGRAGRDGLRAHCLLLFGYGDISKINYFINQKEEKEKRIAKMHLDALISYAESYTCRRIPLLNYFGEKYEHENCGLCDNCEKEQAGLQDVTTEAQKFLSCIIRTGQFYGALHIVEILRGSKSKKIIDKRHNELSTYGIGRDLTKEQWLDLARQFLQIGIIYKDYEYGSLKVTEKGSEVLKGSLTVKGRLKPEEITFKVQKDSALEYDQELFALLRNKRKTIADSMGVPPYVIFPDRTLIEMAYYFPQSINSLSAIHGIGSMKLKRYGNVFLKVLTDYCNAKQIEERLPQSSRKRNSKSAPREKISRAIEIAGIYQSSKNFEDFVKRTGVKPSTVLRHLTTYLLKGNKINTGILCEALSVDEKTKQTVFELYEKLGVNYLSPIYNELDEKVPYDDLHILRICFLNEKNSLSQ
jgi:ATP-dependent DNA helicase RecQ